MKTLTTRVYYILAVIFLSLGVTLRASAQYTGSNFDTGGLYTAIAKDASNNLYVTRVTNGTGGATYEVDKYTNGSGTPAVIYSGLTHEAEDFPWGLVVSSTGNVFISTDFTSSAGAIIKLTKSGSTYTASTYQTGRYFTALAMDATNNLYDTEYDAINKTYAVVKYPAGSASNTAGTNLYDNLKAGAGFSYPTGLVVAPNGDVYVSDAFSNVPAFIAGGHLYKLKLAAGPSYTVSTVSTGNYSASLALDAAGNLYSTENRGSGYSLIKYANATGAGVPVFTGLHTNGIYYPRGIVIYSTANIYLVDGDDGTIGGAVIKIAPSLPTVTTNAATNVSATTATLNGQVNDNGYTTTVNFIYGTSPTLAGATTTPATTGGTINAGSGNTAVALNSTGLAGSTTYYYAVSATSTSGTTQGSILSFITPPSLSYPTPKTYAAGVTIAPLIPTATAVPIPNYGNPVVIGSGFSTPFGVAADAAGNIYVADSGNELLKKIPAGGGAPVTLISGFTNILGVAVDAAGTLYVADAGSTVINKYLAGTTTPIQIASGFSAPYGVAVDRKGNVYVADYSASLVYQIPAGGGTPVAIGTGFGNPTGVAVDPFGNVYVADYSNGALKVIAFNGGGTTSIGTGFAGPVGVATDPAGDVFVADYGNSTVQELPVGGGTQVALGSGYTNPTGVAVDGFGKLVVANYLGGNIEQLTPVGGFYLSIPLPAGMSFDGATGIIAGKPATITAATNYKVTAYNAGGGTSTVVNLTILTNPLLKSLVLSNGTLSPAFVNGTTSYTASVPNSVSSISVTPTTSDAAATVTVNGTSVASGTASGPIALAEGTTTAISTVVTAQDGSTTKTYTVTMTRAVSADATLYSLNTSATPLVPGFDPGTTSYTLNITNETPSVTVTPVTTDANATIKVNGIAVASGTASGAIAVAEGMSAAINIVVTAQDGTTVQTYTINVTRAPSSNAALSVMGPSVGPLSPVFNSGTTSYTLSVPNSRTTMTVTPVTADANATLTVNGTALASGTTSGAIALAEGTTTTINVVVTAQNGVTTDTYSIVVTRAPSSVARLSNIQLSSGTLSPVFATTTISYTTSVPNSTSNITVTPTSAEANATITVNGITVTSGTASGSIALAEGANTVITIVVTSQDGTVSKTYTVTVTRAPSSDATLSAMGPQYGPLTPVFNSGTTSYTLTVGNGSTSMTVKPVSTDAHATIKVNGTTVASGSTSPPVALAVGSNTISVMVTAQDGSTTKIYTITVTRQSGGSDSYGPGISVSNPVEKPSFDDDIIVVHQGISPNGDGVNDFLIIDGIQAYPDNKLTIMNRNGQLVYEAKGYDNSSKTFDGHSNKNGQMQLPGTYFYQLDYTVNGTAKHKTGFIVLKY